jgi:hypothetical protein
MKIILIWKFSKFAKPFYTFETFSVLAKREISLTWERNDKMYLEITNNY